MFSTQDNDWDRYLDLNRQFHFHIYQAAEMPRLLRLIESLWLQIGPLLNLVASKEQMRHGRDNHEAAVRAIATDDGAGARAAIETDIIEAAEPIVQGLIKGDYHAR